MALDRSAFLSQERRLAAKRLVAELDAPERLLLVGLVRGRSIKAFAAGSDQNPADVQHTLALLMNKLGATTVADAVRIGLYAEIDRAD
jgi:FixJ family two-component response regulator